MTFKDYRDKYGSATAFYDAFLDVFTDEERRVAALNVSRQELIAWAISRKHTSREDVRKVLDSQTFMKDWEK